MEKVDELLQKVREFTKTATPEQKLVVVEHLWGLVGEKVRMNPEFRRQYSQTRKSLLDRGVVHV